MTDFPDWAVPGAKVLIVSSYYGTPRNFASATITRLTKTRIVTTDTERGLERQFVPYKYRTGEWEQYGAGSRWQSAPKLIHADSEVGKEIYAEALRRGIENRARNACEDFTCDRTVETAQAAIDALTKYIENNEGATRG